VHRALFWAEAVNGQIGIANPAGNEGLTDSMHTCIWKRPLHFVAKRSILDLISSLFY